MNKGFVNDKPAQRSGGMKQSFFKALQTIIASLLCILAGITIGFIALLIIDAPKAVEALGIILKGFMNFPAGSRLSNFGLILVKVAPLLMCSLSVLYAYKVGMFNIGVAGQYVVGAGLAIYTAVGLGWAWPLCLVAAAIGGALAGLIVGVLKSYRNVNEVISGIMLNWISLYGMRMLLSNVMPSTGKDTFTVGKYKIPSGIAANASQMFDKMGLPQTSKAAASMPEAVANAGSKLPQPIQRLFGFSINEFLTVAVLFALALAFLVWIRFKWTKTGYELRATGLNKNAAKYSGMREHYNLIYTMVMSGALAGVGAGLFYLTGMEGWNINMSSVPAMGFNGIAAAFLGGLHPLGAIFSSYFIQHISSGGSLLTKLGFPSEVADFITSLIIYLCGFVMIIRQLMMKIVKKPQTENVNAEPAPVPAAPAAQDQGQGPETVPLRVSLSKDADGSAEDTPAADENGEEKIDKKDKKGGKK